MTPHNIYTEEEEKHLQPWATESVEIRPPRFRMTEDSFSNTDFDVLAKIDGDVAAIKSDKYFTSMFTVFTVISHH